MKPKLSILLPAMKGYHSVRAVLEAWEAQTCRGQLEILVVCPGVSAAAPATLPCGQVIVPVGAVDLHEARAIGMQHVSADYVTLAEDHCLPDPDWARAILNRIDEGWDAVASTLRPGERACSWAEGSFLLGYSEWMSPVSGGPTKVLCGWNGTIRTQLLRQFEPGLASELLVGAFLVRQLGEQGHRFYLEDSARMRHFDPRGGIREVLLLLIVGLGFGAMRTRRWPLAARLLYPLATPAVAFLHWKRAFAHYRRAGAACGLRANAPIAAAALALAWGLGEAAGSWLGVARVAPYLWRTEVKPVSAGDVARSSAREQGGLPNAALMATQESAKA